MIAPYDTIIQAVSSDLAQLGFILEIDERAGMTFRRGNFTLEFNTEQYNHPSLQTLLGYEEQTGKPRKFHVATLMKVFSPNDQLFLRGEFDHQTYEGTKDALKFELQFLKTYEDKIFCDPPTYISDCHKSEVEAMRRAGFIVDDNGVLG